MRTVLLAAAAGSAAPLPHPATGAVSSSEQAAWNRARSSGSQDAFQSYLSLYPTGQYAEEAFRTIVEQAWTSGLRTAPAAGGSDRLGDPDRALVIAAAQTLY